MESQHIRDEDYKENEGISADQNQTKSNHGGSFIHKGFSGNINVSEKSMEILLIKFKNGG